MLRRVSRLSFFSGMALAMSSTGCELLIRNNSDVYVDQNSGLVAKQSVLKSNSDIVAVQATENAVQPNIDLDTALETAMVWNPVVRLAREAIREAEAQSLAANSLYLPSINTGINYHWHNGNLQRSPGTILESNNQSLYFGGGARSLAAETVGIPGIRIIYPLADIITEPKLAEQRLISRRSDAITVQNINQIEVASAYLDLIRAGNVVKELQRSENEFSEIVRTTQAFAKTGQGREADANRALAHRELIHRQRVEAEGERVAASVRLSALLNLDPLITLTPPDQVLTPMKLMDVNTDVNQYVSMALTNRPEIVTRNSEISEARLRLRQEQIRPWLPTISAGFSVGGFGGGSNLAAYEFSHFATRNDFDVSAVWTFQNVGMGNRALMNRNRAQLFQSIAQLEGTTNQIHEEVIEAHAQVLTTATQIETARRQVVSAEEGYREESSRIKQGIGLPLELLDSTNSLLESRLALIKAISEHNLAQFRLLGALGTPPEAGTVKEK